MPLSAVGIVRELRRLGYDVLTSYDAGQATLQERAVEYGNDNYGKVDLAWARRYGSRVTCGNFLPNSQ